MLIDLKPGYSDIVPLQILYLQYKAALKAVCSSDTGSLPPALPCPDDTARTALRLRIQSANTAIATFAEKMLECRAAGNFAAARLYCEEACKIIDQLLQELPAGAEVPDHHSGDIRISHRELEALYDTIRMQDAQLRDALLRKNNTEKETERLEQRFNNIIVQAPIGITLLTGPDLLVEFANETYLQIVDREAQAFIGKTLFEALPEVRTIVQPIMEQVLATGVPYFGNEFEVPLNRFGHMELAYFNFVYQPLFAADGHVTGIMVIANDITQQVAAKRALEKSESLFRELVLQSPVPMTIFKGEDWIIDIANESMLNHIWRRQLEDVQGKKLMDVFPELAGQQFPDLLRRVYATGQPYNEREAVAFVNGPDGSKKYYLDFEYAPLREADGSVSGIMVTANDVTEMVAAREQIKDAAERLSLATDGTKLATWDMNLNNGEIIYSPRLAVIFGYPESRILTHSQLLDHLQPEDRSEIVERAFDEALKTGVYQYEARLIHPDKSIHWVRTQGKVIFNEDHIPVRMLGTMMDISEQKRAEQSLRESERKFRTLADSMPQHIWTADTEGKLNYFNDTVSRYTGFSPQELEADGWQQIIHPEDWHPTMHSWLEAVRSGRDFLFEHRFRRADGNYRWQLSRAVPQRDDEGQIQMWVGTSTDIHDRKLFSDELEQKVQQRTEELMLLNEQLIQSNAELEQFAYVASHDLQEPLRKIQTFATRIAELDAEHLSDKGKDYFVRMQSASKRMQQLIHDVLSFSRVNRGEQEPALTDLQVLLDNVKDQLAERIEQTQTTIRSDKLPVLPVIPYQMDQLFTNLISNSIKFSREGIPTYIDITYRFLEPGMMELPSADPQRAYHSICFRDNGIGFESTFRERIFQVFQRLHGRKDYEGTGIGLAICKKIMENHDGFIIAESEPDQGAAFTLYLPGEG